VLNIESGLLGCDAVFCGRKSNRILQEHAASVLRGNKDAHIAAVLNVTAFYERTLSRVKQLQATNSYI
jgi:hypothetical protein